MRVLIVEDEPITRTIMKKMLSHFGDCDVAVNGQEAIDACALAWEEKKPYDLICMDIMMPNVSGRDALRQIRAMEEARNVNSRDGIKVVMTTALDDSETVEAAFREGATGYLVKPITREKLVEELRRLDLLIK